MKTLRTTAVFAAFMLVSALCSLAFADSTAGADAAAGAATWTPLIVVGLSLIAYSIRNFTPNTGWLHTGGGHFVIALITGALGAIADAIQTHGLTKQAIMWGLASAIGGAIGAANPSVQNGGVAPAPDARTKQAGRIRLRFMLALGGLVAVAVGCKTTLGKCELGALPQTAQTVVVDVMGIISNPASVISDLEALPNQPAVTCVIAAIEKWMDEKAASDGGASSKMLVAGSAERDAHARSLVSGFLAIHRPTACSGRATAAVERVLR